MEILEMKKRSLATCSRCGEAIYKGDTWDMRESMLLCGPCLDDYNAMIKKYFRVGVFIRKAKAGAVNNGEDQL